MIEVKKSWMGSLNFAKAEAPEWAVGEVIWLEQKEPTLLRPTTRMRWRVKARVDFDEHVAFELEQP